MSDGGDTIELAELIRSALDTRQRKLHTALPGAVVSYDAATQTASIDLLVELAIPKRGGGHGYEQVATLHGVPIGHPRGGGYITHFPLLPGDHVWVMFAERSMDEVIRNGSRSQPRDLRMHDLSFAYAIPAGSPAKADQISGMPADALVIQHESGTPRLQLSASGVRIVGDLEVTGDVTVNADTAPVAVSTHMHPTAMGPSGSPTPGT